ncbi:MAG: molybdopterin molybdotransferase MoeA [Deltaproteobacteria bacterium]|nr:molybdopterin molybdotransferase MoeA [Deltaproteobacteria bacterium]
MITVEEAKKTVLEQTSLGSKTTLSLREALGCVLAEDIFSPIDSPPFDSSAMDGFAIDHTEAPGHFKKSGTITAGEGVRKKIVKGECLEIMTGGRIPEGATAVVPYEEAGQKEKEVRVAGAVPEGAQIRRRGEQLQRGELVLPAGARLRAGAVGFLASLGVLEVSVHRPPKVFILPTGSELVCTSKDLQDDKIFESNGLCLQTALQGIPAEVTVSRPVPDLPKILSGVLEVVLRDYDMILISGGVSVGKHDYVKNVLEKFKVQTLFWGVAQKPGKPLYFGKKGDTLVFGLPGNPASTLVCFYEYVRPAVLRWLGDPEPELKEAKAALAKTYDKKEGRTHFVRAFAHPQNGRWRVRPLEGQDSHFMKSFALANCLMVVPQGEDSIDEGEEVTIQWLP